MGILTLVTVWGVITLVRGPIPWGLLASPPSPTSVTRLASARCGAGLRLRLRIAAAQPSAEAMPLRARRTSCGRPGCRRCNRTSFFVTLFTVAGDRVSVRSSSSCSCPPADQPLWTNSPLAGLAQHLAGPAWATRHRRHRARRGGRPAPGPGGSPRARTTPSSSSSGCRSRARCRSGSAFLHSRFGTPSRAIDVAVAATILVMFVSSGRVKWLAHAYAVAIVATLALKIAALVRLRRLAAGGAAVPGAVEPARRRARDSARAARRHAAGRRRGRGDGHRSRPAGASRRSR